MRGLIVKREHLELIRHGTKTQTRRLHKHPLRAGERTILKKTFYETWTPEIIIEIIDAYEQQLRDMTEHDARREGFKSLQEFKAMWPRYTRMAWRPNMVVMVYEFRLL